MVGIKTTPHPPVQAELKVDFLIVGAGIAGLACACALSRVGHRVTVLERDNELLQDSGGTRIPPNLSKILFNWGLEEEVRRMVVRLGVVNMYAQHTGEFLGSHTWETLEETRGELSFTRHADIQKLLHDVALRYGAKLRMGVVVTDVDPQAGTVTLQGGQVLTAAVIVGADGLSGVTRKMLLSKQPWNLSFKFKSSLAMNLYTTVIPGPTIVKDPDLKKLCDQNRINGTTTSSTFVWMGESKSVIGFPISSANDYALLIWGPQGDDAGTWKDSSFSPGKLQKILEPCEAILAKLANVATDLTCVSVTEHPGLEDWVDGRLVLIGEAAHPFVAGASQTNAIAVEDGAVLAKLFSHLRSEDQISSFLWAFQEIRQPRCRYIAEHEVKKLRYMTVPPSEFQVMRDAELKRMSDSRITIFSYHNGNEGTRVWGDLSEIFGYDAEDEADNWWVQWGLLRERGRGTVKMDLTGLKFARNVEVAMM